MTGFGLPPEFRLRSPADFERAYLQKIRAADSRLLLYAARNTLGVARLGCSVSRKHGNSVQRHRLKRLLKEAFRLIHSELPAGIDLVVIPQRGVEFTLSECQSSLARLAGKVAMRLPSPE